MTDPDSKWSRLSAVLREQGVHEQLDPNLPPPPGFSTRIVARALIDSRADATGLLLWRRWSLAGACAAVLACGTLFVVQPNSSPSPQIIPVPTLDDLPTLPHP